MGSSVEGYMYAKAKKRDLVPPPDPSTLDPISLPQPYTQPDDGPMKGPKHVVVSHTIH
jgi:hypothetical protein